MSIQGAARESFEAWRCRAFQMMDVQLPPAERAAAFRGQASRTERGGIGLWRYRSDAIEARRDALRCRRDQGDEIILLLLRAGRAELDDGEATILRPGDLYVFDMARPLDIRWQAHAELHFVVPRALLSRLVRAPERLSGLHLDGTQPLGRALARQLALLDRSLDGLDAEAGGAFLQRGIEMLVRLLADLRQGKDAPPPDRRAALLAAVDDNLRNPALGPALLSSLLGLSRRSLYRLVEGEDAGISQLILRRRLERCRDEIASPASRGRWIADIALDWGFVDYQSFCRAFRRCFGSPPSAARHAGSSPPGT